MGASLLMLLALLTACAAPQAQTEPTAAPPAAQTLSMATNETQPAASTVPETTEKAGEYQVITAQKAKPIMDNEQGVVVVDGRGPDEHRGGRIQNAKLLPLGNIAKLAATELPDKNATILVYCRSGRRSRMGAETLISLGYTHVLDFGGIMDWPYEVVK